MHGGCALLLPGSLVSARACFFGNAGVWASVPPYVINLKKLNIFKKRTKNKRSRMKIPLKNRKGEIVDYALVDNEDFEKLIEKKWSKGKQGYPCGRVNNTTITMHQFIIGKAPDKQIIVHINQNKLDNRKENLRYATYSQIFQNQFKKEGCSSKYKGVFWSSPKQKWQSQSMYDGRIISLGSFVHELDAAKAYDTYVYLNFGPYAQTNGTVAYEDVKDIDINTLIACKINKYNLPKNISKIGTSYLVRITYNKINYIKCVSTLDLAKETLAAFQKEIDVIKQKENETHDNLEITRNSNGEAVLHVKDKTGAVVDYIVVDDEKWHDCMQYSWSKFNLYFQAAVEYGKIKRIHQFILGVNGDVLIDHIDRNPKNNKVSNLRRSNVTNNNHNKTKSKNASSKYFGVSFNKKYNKYCAVITKDGKTYNLGSYVLEKDAANAYNTKATELYGDFANLNNMEE